MDVADRELQDVVGRLLGWSPSSWRAVSRGYTANQRWVVSDGRRSAFVKAAVDDLTAGWLRAEQRVYEAVSGSFLPTVLGSDDTWPLLVLEDLSAADWPPPWPTNRVSLVLETLGDVARAAPELALESAESMRSELNGWPSIAARPEPLLSLGACEPAWLERALPALAAAAARARLAGEDLLHLDVRSDNLCFVGDTVKLVDWNWAVRGDRRFDVAAWLPSLAAEGGPPPWEVVGPGYREYAALLAGFWARQAPTPAPPGGSDVRELQRRLLTIALRWAARDLDLPAPDAH